MINPKEILYDLMLVRTSSRAGTPVCGTRYFYEWGKYPWNKVDNLQRDTVIVEGLSIAVQCQREGKGLPPAIRTTMTKEGALEAMPIWNYKS